MPVRQTLDQLNADARQHCDGCAKCDTLRDSWVMCSGVRVGFANGICPLSLWDHSQPVKHEPRRNEWPIIARVIRRLRTPEDTGVGDTLARLIVGGEWFKAAYKSLIGKSCGCDDRQAWLNKRYGYDRTV